MDQLWNAEDLSCDSDFRGGVEEEILFFKEAEWRSWGLVDVREMEWEERKLETTHRMLGVWRCPLPR